MRTLLVICITFIGLWGCFHALYWRVFRPVLLTRLRYAIFSARDRLRSLVIAGKLAETDQAYRILEGACYRGLKVLERANLLDIWFMKPSQEIVLRAERDLMIIDEAGVALRQIHRDVVSVIFGALFANSPGLFPLIGLMGMAFVAAFWFGKAKTALNRWRISAWSLVYAPNPAG